MTHAPKDRRPLVEPLETRLLASASTLLSYDFAGVAWQQTPGPQSAGVSATLAYGGYGTVDVEGSSTTSGALRLTVDAAPASGSWSSALSSGPLALSNAESNLGKLTLGFMLSASQARTVRVLVTSYDAAGNRTGALQSRISPAAAYNYQRYALDLSTMTAAGAGAFVPTAPKIGLDFEMASDAGWSAATPAQLRVDNVSFSKPAYYVSATTGSDTYNGLTEARPFANIKKALDASQAGDVICVMGGTYTNTGSATNKIDIRRGGTPAAWVVLKNYPGQSPVISSEAWNAIALGTGSSNAFDSTTPAIAYVEVRGLHVVGSSAKVGSRSAPDGPYDPAAPNADQYGPYATYIGLVDGRTNGNGIGIDGRYMANRPHDIRIADNVVEQCAGGGIGALEADRIVIENNVVRDNCYWDIYGTSGISILSAYDFDGTSNNYTRVVRNNVSSGNIHKEQWAAAGRYSDGNGIIIDINHNSQALPTDDAAGRTLVTNNLCFDNGGSGVHAFSAKHVDIVNNTAYLNSASPYLSYGQIFASGSTTDATRAAGDVNVFSNVLYAPPGKPTNGGVRPTASNAIVYRNNVYFGGTAAWAADAFNVGNVTADPQLLAPSAVPATADFRLASTSPAINLGTATRAPQLDLAGGFRYGNPDAGAYEYRPPAPASVALAAASDTGVVGDDKTRLNNASTATRFSLVVGGTVGGATVDVYAGAALIGSATALGTSTTITTDGATALADGTYAITARQSLAGAPSASASPAREIAVDATRPTLVGTPLANAGAAAGASRSQVRTVAWTFSEPVDATLASFTLVDRGTGTTLNLSSRSVNVADNVVTLLLDTPVADAGAQLFLPNGNYALSLSPTVLDAAGNTLDARGDGSSGATATFAFHKLLGDFNGDRRVTSADYLLWNRAYGRTTAAVDPAFDLNGDGRVTSADYVLWNRQYGTSVDAMLDGLTFA